MESRKKAILTFLLLAIDLLLLGIFFALDQEVGYYITLIAFFVITYFKFKAGPAFIPKDKESLAFRYTKWKEKHYLLSVFLGGHAVLAILSLMIIISGQFQLGAFVVFILIFEFATCLGLLARKQYMKMERD